ncbi:conserved membrane hypothetical protein [Candidatus Sulfopaludibacter sp. SbA3]|nr:conserved membrane hypothetical protein [Candidatus Sulfopaludibacter sp. SbA3]
MKRLATPLLALTIFLLNVWLNAPLFMSGDLPFPGSIERGYVGMARFVAEHPNPWGWNPFPYCGLPTGFMYVPGLPYTAALWIHLLPHTSPDAIYRTIVSLMTCLGPVTLFFFALHFTGSRRWSFAMAVAYSFLSPSYALFPAVEKDRGVAQLPWRIQVLAKYGEGPHNTGLTLLPLALLGLWRAATGRRYALIFTAALVLAAIPLSNWVAAFALAISCVLLLLAAWGERGFQLWRALAAAALAYLLACFWLTPSFVKTIAFNWPVDSFAYHLKEQQVWLLAGMTAGVLIIRAAFRLLRGSFYFCLVTMGAWVFGWVATAFYVYGLDTIPESRRYAIEFELFLALALVEALRLAMRSSNSTTRLCAVGAGGVMFLVGAPQLWAYATEGWQKWLPAPPENTVEYRLGKWIAGQGPVGRVFASGGMRFRLNSWFDIQQVGGGFETGLQNRVPYDLSYDIRAGHDAASALLELKALGAQYVVVHGPKSKEYYRDFLRPERLASLPAVYRIDDDTIYALPGRGLAHVVTPEEMQDSLRYVAAIEDRARPALHTQWVDASALDISGPTVPLGELVSVQVNADPGWRATQDGGELAMSQDKLGFIVLHTAPAAATHIEMRYHGTLEQRVMAALGALAWVGAIGLLLRKHLKRC